MPQLPQLSAPTPEDFAYSRLLSYAAYQWPQYEDAAHHRLIARKLEAVERGEINRLMIFMPPRHGKSLLASEFFPAWYLGRNPDHYVIAATYAQELADDFGRKVKNQIADPAYQAVFPGVGLADDSKSAKRFHIESGSEVKTAQKGAYYAVGVGGPLTGRGAHLLLIDDPVKNREEADSEIVRRTIKDWYTSTAYTRLMPGARVVLIQTRWHEDDLAGWLLQEHSHEGWEVLSLPAINDDGEALWPERYSADALERIRSTVGPRDWTALYQQEPRPSGGGEFRREWVEFYDGTPDDVAGGTNKYILVDPASEKRKNNDYTSIWCIGLGQDGNYYVLDMVRDRLNLTERAKTVMQMHRRWKPMQVRYERYGMMADIQYLRELQGRENYRFAIEEVAGQTPKNDRIRRLIPLFEQRKVWFPQSLHRTDHTGKVCELVDAFIHQELLAFPVGVHEDMLDALARIAEPDMPLTWPQQQIEDKYQSAAYRRGGRMSAWAA